MKYIIKEYEGIRQKVCNMSVRELISTVCFPDVILQTDNETYNSEAAFFHQGTKDEIKAKFKKWTEYSEKEPILASDFECGCGDMISGSVKFPSYYALGKLNNPEAVYKIGRAAAQEARELGYKWTFSPCVDILINHESPITSIRTAGQDAETVINTGRAYMKGLQDGGIAATLKHFPGDGAANMDQHLTTVENTLSYDEWKKSYGKVFQTLIDDGAMAVMPGHISLPSYDEPDKDGAYPPATLSRKLLTDLLKNELGFKGIIVSDAVTMGGFCGYMNYYRACARFLMSGGDIILFAHPDEKMYSHFEKYIEEGYLTLDVLKDRAYRVCCFAKYLKEELKPIDDIKYDANELEKYVVENSVDIVRDKNKVLPFTLTADTAILHTVILNNYTADKPYEALDKKLRKICKNVTTLVDPGCDRLREDTENKIYDLVICSCGCTCAYGTNVIRMHGALARNFMLGWTKMGTPVVFVNYSNPFLGEEYKYLMDTIINTYGASESTADKVLNLIFE